MRTGTAWLCRQLRFGSTISPSGRRKVQTADKIGPADFPGEVRVAAHHESVDDDRIEPVPGSNCASSGRPSHRIAQRITGFAGLADRIDLVLVAASPLPPPTATGLVHRR